MRCSKCGADVPKGTKFCPNCGCNLENESSPMGVPKSSSNQNNKVVLIVVVVVFLILSIIGASFFVFMNNMAKNAKGFFNGIYDSANNTINKAQDIIKGTDYSINGYTFNFKDDSDFNVLQAGNSIVISDYGGTATVTIEDGNYNDSTLSDSLKNTLIQSGYNVSLTGTKKIGNMNYLVYEATMNYNEIVIAYTNAKNGKLVSVIINSGTTDFEYEFLNDISPIIENAVNNSTTATTTTTTTAVN
jgi:hypothetical protein